MKKRNFSAEFKRESAQLVLDQNYTVAAAASAIADRWHLLKNIGDALERMMYRHMPLIRLVATELSPQKQIPEASLVPVSTLRRPEKIKQQRRDKQYQRWSEVDALHKKGCGIREISRLTGLSRVTVRRWIQSKAFPEISTKPPKPGLLDPWQGWLEEQRINGNHNASQLWREMVDAGFTGSETTVRDAVSRWRKHINAPVVAPRRLRSASRVSRWLMPCRMIRGEENYASRFIESMCQKEPQLKMAQQLSLNFYRMLKMKNKSQLNQWFIDVSRSGLVDLQRVAAGMEADATAIKPSTSSLRPRTAASEALSVVLALQGGDGDRQYLSNSCRLRRASAPLTFRSPFNIGWRLHAAKRHQRQNPKMNFVDDSLNNKLFTKRYFSKFTIMYRLIILYNKNTCIT